MPTKHPSKGRRRSDRAPQTSQPAAVGLSLLAARPAARGAPLWRRTAAWSCDIAAALACSLIPLTAWTLVETQLAGVHSARAWTVGLVMWAGMAAYASVTYIAFGRTLGQRLAGLRVRRTPDCDTPPSCRRLLSRAALGWLVALAALWPLNILWAVRGQRRSLVDRWTGCLLVSQR